MIGCTRCMAAIVMLSVLTLTCTVLLELRLSRSDDIEVYVNCYGDREMSCLPAGVVVLTVMMVRSDASYPGEEVAAYGNRDNVIR